MARADGPLPHKGEVTALIRSKRWSETPLGPLEQWPSSLQTVLRLMLTSRYAMWLGWGPDLLFFYNDAYREQTLGTKHPGALGSPFTQVWGEIWDDLAPRIRHVLSTGEATWDSGLLLFLERNGYSEETYHTFSYSPAPDDFGGIGGLFCVVIEETERVIAERRAALLRELASGLGPTKTTAAVLSAMEACIAQDARDLPFSLTYLFDDDEKTARLVARTGIDPDHPGAPAVASLVDEAMCWPLARVLADQQPVEVRLDARAWPAGPWKKPPALAWVVPISRAGQASAAGAFIAAINPHRTLDSTYRSFIELFVGQLGAGLANARGYETERKRAEALAQIDRAKTAFFSNVSHEFRTPLTLMLGPTEDALASPDRALRGEDLAIVHRNELRLLKLVNALLDFSRLEAGRVQATYVPTDLAELTADLASAFRSAMERGGLRYEVDCPPLDERIYVDRDMWEKIVLNLLSNALKFTLHGGVRVTLRKVGAHVELVVRDSGPGVAPSELPRMFERFHRIEGTPARTHEGSGIGLALVRDLVELHGGGIRIESELGHGAAFIVSLPIGSAHLPAGQVQQRVVEPRAGDTRAASYVAEALRWVPRAETTHEPARAIDVAGPNRARVLVADDNADMRDYIARLLGERWTVDVASDGAAALDAIRRSPPDLVLSDVMMPRLDGFGLVRSLREDPATRTIPVILLSARAGEDASDEGLRAGANDYLIKPFSARELFARVSSQLTIARIQREAEAGKEAQRRVVESLFLNAPAAIAVIRGEQQTIEFANTMALEIWGKPAEVIGKPMLEALPELRGAGFDELIRQVITTGVPFVGDDHPATFMRGNKQETVYLKFVYAPAENAEGVVDGIGAFGFEVTRQVLGRRHATLAATVGRAFTSTEALAAQLARCCDALVVVAAESARIWTYNPGHEVLELRASAGVEVDRAADQSTLPMSSPLGRIASELRPHVSEEKGRALSAYPLVVGDRLIGLMALTSKEPLIAETHAAVTTVGDQIALGIDRDNSERFRELFIGMLGHDLRNPLNAVAVGVHMLAGADALSPKLRRSVERIRSSASRMERMINQVLDFTRARSGGGIPIERAPCDLRAICGQVVEELAAANPERRVETSFDGDSTGAWDADRLAQVVSNLLGNALTYGRPDTPVRLQVAGAARVVRCSVQNDGAPIPSAFIPTLFNPFRRATHGKSAGTRGLGLGLYIAHQIVGAHGGNLTVTSTDQEGTVFTFELPRGPGGDSS